MAFTNKSITEEEAAETSGKPWKDGEYKFRINSAEEMKSKADNDMLKLVVDVFKGASFRSVYHYIVFTESTQWSARLFYKSIGKIDLYDSGIIEANSLIGEQGLCSLTSEKNDNGKVYNKISTFLPPEEKSGVDLPSDEDDQIPF